MQIIWLFFYKPVIVWARGTPMLMGENRSRMCGTLHPKGLLL